MWSGVVWSGMMSFGAVRCGVVWILDPKWEGGGGTQRKIKQSREVTGRIRREGKVGMRMKEGRGGNRRGELS